MGPAWWNKYSYLILPIINSDQTILFGLLFPTVDKAIENAFVRDLGGTMERYMGYIYRLGYDGSRGYTRWLLWYTA